MTRCEDLYAKSILTIFGFVCARYVFVVVPFQKKVNGRINLVQNHYLEFYTLKIRSLLNMEQDSIKSSSISSRLFYSKLQDSGIEQIAAPCKFFRIFQYPLKRACSLNAVFNSGPHSINVRALQYFNKCWFPGWAFGIRSYFLSKTYQVIFDLL